MKKIILEESFITHLFVEFYYGSRHGLMLSEQIGKHPIELLSEQYGLFKNCETIARTISSFIKRNYNRQIIDIPDLSDKWFKKITIVIVDWVNQAAYSPNRCEIDKQTNIFDRLIIYINPSIVGSNDLLPLLMHELTHAYQDYNLRLHNSSLDYEFSKKGSDKNSLKDSPDEYQDINDNKLRELKYELSWLLYHLNDFERSSYIAQITGYLKKCNQRFLKISDVMDYLKNTIPYQNYEVIYEWSEHFININDENAKNKIMEWIDELSSLSFQRYSDFIIWLKDKRKKYRYKFDKILPKIAYEHFEMQRFTKPATTHSIRFKPS